MNNKSFRVSGPDVIHEMFDDDLVVVDLSSGRYFGFNTTAAAVWEAAIAGVSQRDIVSNLCSDANVVEFLDSLIEFRLLSEIPTDQATSSLTSKQQELFAKHTVPPEVTVYDDLSDLIVADPIHDASNEEGRPVRDTESA